MGFISTEVKCNYISIYYPLLNVHVLLTESGITLKNE